MPGPGLLGSGKSWLCKDRSFPLEPGSIQHTQNAKQPCLIYLLSHQVLQQHKSADTMVALMKVYEEEDEAYQDLVTMATQFYQYLLQPFRDMRELATLYKLEILVSLPFQSERLSCIVGHQLLLELFRLKSCNIPCFCLYLLFFPLPNH